MTSSENKSKIITYFLISLFAVFIALISNSKLSGEDDLFWYLSTGRYIVQTGTFPSADVFGYTTAGKPWIPFEWGWDVLNYYIFQIDGFISLSLFATLLILLIYYLLFRLLVKFKVNTSLSFIVLLLLTFGMLPRLTIKPHLATYLLFMVVLTIIINYKYFDRKNFKILFYLPLVFALWMNLHMGVLAGLMMLGIFTISEIINYTFKFTNPVTPALDKKSLIRLIVISLLSAAATLINPHFINTYIYAMHIVSMKQLEIIYEWVSPFNIINQGQLFIYIYYLFIGGIIPVLIYSYKKKDVFAALLYIGFLLHSTRAVRLTVDFVLTASIFIALSLNYLFNSEKTEKILNSIAAKSAAIVILLALIVSIPRNDLYHAINSPRLFGSGIDQNNFPVKMFKFIKDSDLNRNYNFVFNTYEMGGYYVWHFPDKQNFIGSRGINDEIWNDYTNIINTQPGFQAILDSYKVDNVLWFVPGLNYGLNPSLIKLPLLVYLNEHKEMWNLVYWDDNSFIFVREIQENNRFLSKYMYTYITPFNIFYNKKDIDFGLQYNKRIILLELRRKLSEDPNGILINMFIKEHPELVKELDTLDQDK